MLVLIRKAGEQAWHEPAGGLDREEDLRDRTLSGDG